MRAAEKFLDPDYMAASKRLLEPKLDDISPMRDDLIEEEMKDRGFSERPKTVEDWKERLQRFYAAMVADAKRRFLSALLRLHPEADVVSLDLLRLALLATFRVRDA